jgi:hypothetical protein
MTTPLCARPRFRLRNCLCGALLGIAASTAFAPFAVSRVHAAVVMALDLPALVQASDAVVVAKTLSQASRMTNGGRRIVTDYTLQVERVLKGTAHANDRIVVTLLGGTVGDLALTVPGEASFDVGSRSVAFLRKAQSGDGFRVVGMAQGVMPVAPVSANNRVEMVMPHAGDVSQLKQQPDGSYAPSHDAAAKPEALSTLLSRIEGLVAHAHGH